MSEKLLRHFTHVTIPAEIWVRRDISFQSKALWAELRSLHDPEKGGCYASDEYLCDFLGLKRSRLHECFKELKDVQLLETVSFNGRQVIRKAIVPEVEYLSGQQLSGKPDSRNPSYPENRTADVRFSGFCPYIENKEENIDMSELPFGRVASYFFSGLLKLNPKVKTPNLAKWAKEISLLAKDGNTEADILKVIDYVLSTHDRPSGNGFCWANVVLSPQALRKNFAKIWGEMGSAKKLPQNSLKNNQKLAELIANQFKRNDIVLGNNYLEFINGQYATHLKFDDKQFSDKCLEELKKRKLNLNKNL